MIARLCPDMVVSFTKNSVPSSTSMKRADQISGRSSERRLWRKSIVKWLTSVVEDVLVGLAIVL